MKKSPFVDSRRSRRDANFRRQFKGSLPKDTDDEDAFDKIPSFVSGGKRQSKRRWWQFITKEFDRWLHSNLGRSWADVQADIKNIIPDDAMYHRALEEVYLISDNGAGKQVLAPGGAFHFGRWGREFNTDIDTLRKYGSPREYYYVDEKNILRYISKRQKKDKRAIAKENRQFVITDGLILFKRSGQFFKARMIDGVRDVTITTPRYWHMSRGCSLYVNGAGLCFWHTSLCSYVNISLKDIRQMSKKDINDHRASLELITLEAFEGPHPDRVTRSW